MLSISLDQPFRLSFGDLLTLPRVIYTVKLDSGIVGYGEASIDFPFSKYDMYDVYRALADTDLTGRRIEEREAILDDREIVEGLIPFQAAYSAFNMALDDAYGRSESKSIIDLYGRQRDGGLAMRSIPFEEKGARPPRGCCRRARRAICPR